MGLSEAGEALPAALVMEMSLPSMVKATFSPAKTVSRTLRMSASFTVTEIFLFTSTSLVRIEKE